MSTIRNREDVPKKLTYLGMEWKYRVTLEMFDYPISGCNGWIMHTFEPIYVGGKTNVKHINGKFNKLADDIHIAIEHGAYNPTGIEEFHGLVVATPKDKKFPDKLPEWKDKYEYIKRTKTPQEVYKKHFNFDILKKIRQAEKDINTLIDNPKVQELDTIIQMNYFDDYIATIYTFDAASFPKGTTLLDMADTLGLTFPLEIDEQIGMEPFLEDLENEIDKFLKEILKIINTKYNFNGNLYFNLDSTEYGDYYYELCYKI